MHTTPPTIHWSYYTAGFIAAIIIGIDCAVNAAFYMTLMGGFYAIPIVLISCAVAGAILNTILYANDFPEAISELKHNLQEFFSSLYNWRQNVEAFQAKSPDEQKASIYRSALSIAKEMVAVASGIMLGLFTYSAYMEMHIAWMSTPLVILFCAAYLFGTYALIRVSLNALYADGETVKEKWSAFSRTQLVVAAILISIFMMASLWTIFTFYAGAIAAIHVISPALTPVTPVFFVLLLIGETIFSVKTAIWLCSKLNQEKSTPRQHLWRNILMNTMTLLNGLANAAITAYGSSKISGYTGFLLSVGVMYKSTHEIDIEKQSPHSKAAQEKIYTIKKAQVITVYVLSAAVMIWLATNPIPALVTWTPVIIVSLIALCMITTMFIQGKVDILGITTPASAALSTTQLVQQDPQPVALRAVQETAKKTTDSVIAQALQNIASPTTDPQQSKGK
jgi:hypothetical protein